MKRSDLARIYVQVWLLGFVVTTGFWSFLCLVFTVYWILQNPPPDWLIVDDEKKKDSE